MSERLKFYVLAAIVTISVTTIAFIYSYEVEELDNKRLQTKIEELTQEKEKLEKAIKELDSSTPGIYKPHLKDIITSTLAYIGEKNLLDWTKLIYLTIATESNLGKYSKQLKGPAKGITQVALRRSGRGTRRCSPSTTPAAVSPLSASGTLASKWPWSRKGRSTFSPTRGGTPTTPSSSRSTCSNTRTSA